MSRRPHPGPAGEPFEDGALSSTAAPIAAFADRIMAAIAREPAPTPTRNLISAARARSVRDAGAAVWVAWHLATVRTWRVAPGVRARSLALVLAVVAMLGTATISGAAALRVAADPVVDMFQPGVDEQGQVENTPDVDEGPGRNNDDPGVNQPGNGNGDVDQPGGHDQNGGNGDGANSNEGSGVNEPGASSNQDQSNADDPNNGTGERDTNQPGNGRGSGDRPGGTQDDGGDSGS